jgi:two-component system, LytTR family, sensor kinase
MTSRPSRPPIWLFVSLAWLGPAVLAILQAHVQQRLGNWERIPWPQLLWQGGDWFLYALLTPAVFWMGRRFPLVRGHLRTRIPVHLAGAVLLCGAWAGMGQLLQWAIIPGTPFPNSARMIGWFFTSMPFGVAVYFGVLGAEHALFYFLRAQERETQAAQLAAQLAEARLGALRMQMQPHFLLNTLNAIAVVLRDQDTATAGRMLDQLGEMLQRVMRTDRPPEVPLLEELEFTRRFLGISEVRFSDRLRPIIDIDPTLHSAAVPEFVLQPLVENALRHGLAKRSDATLLRIEAHRDGADLLLTVTDDGPGPGDPAGAQEGVGLGNTRARLATLYGARAGLALRSLPGGGTSATVRLPYRAMATAHD